MRIAGEMESDSNRKKEFIMNALRSFIEDSGALIYCRIIDKLRMIRKTIAKVVELNIKSDNFFEENFCCQRIGSCEKTCCRMQYINEL